MADGHAESSGLVGKMWDNLVIRANIVEQSDTSTLLALLRVDKATFGLAVSQLYRSVSDLEATQKRLNSVKSSTRCAAYARAIRHIDGVDLETSNIGLLRLTLPDLRSVSVRNRGRTGRTGKAGALTWKIDDQGGVADPVYTMDGWDDQALWDVKMKHIKAILPEDWPITFRPKEVTIRDAATATRWLAASSSDEFPLNMPQKLVIHALEQSTQELVYDFIAEQPIDRVIDEAWLSTGTKSDTVSGPGPSVAVKSPFRAICNALRSCTNNVKHMRLFGLSLPMSWLDDLLPVLVTHRTTNIRVWLSPKHLEILAASWGGRERLARHMGNGGRRVANRLELSVHVPLSHWSDHDATSILSKLLSDRQWIQNLARGLLFATSETSRHRLNIVLANFPDGTGDPETLRQASDKLTDTLNGTIDTIVEMIRDLRTPGFRLLPAAERRSTSPAPAPIAAVEVEIKAEGAEEDGRNEASGMTPEEASGITEDELWL